MDHFPLIDFHCPLYVDSHFCNFPLFVVRREATQQRGMLTTLGQALSIPPGTATYWKEMHTEETMRFFLSKWQPAHL